MRALITGIFVVIAASLGILIGVLLPGREKQSADLLISSPKTDKPAKTNFNVLGSSNAPVSALLSKVERDLSMTTGVTKWLVWLEAMEKAGLNDFPALLAKAGNNSLLQRLIISKWVETNPRHVFDSLLISRRTGTTLSGSIENILFEEWVKKDPQAVISAMSEVPDFDDWRMSVSGMLVEKDAELGLKMMSEWNVTNYSPRQSTIAKWAAQNPLYAAEFALAHPAGHATDMALQTIGKEWAKINPQQAMEFARGKGGRMEIMLAQTTLKTWAETDLKSAAEWLGQADVQQRNRLSGAFVEAWAKNDPSGALAWCESYLTGNTLSGAVGSVFKSVAAKDVQAAANLVSELAPSQARAHAASAIAEKWFPSFDSNKPVPPEMITWLAGLDSSSLSHVLNNNYWRWTQNDPASLAEFLKTRNIENLPSHIYGNAARELARKNPEDALNWASSLPQSHRINAGSDAFHQWQQYQPEAALNWLNKLPKEDNRREPFFRTAVQNMAWDANGAQRLGVLPVSERPAARRIIGNMSLAEEKKAALLQALD